MEVIVKHCDCHNRVDKTTQSLRSFEITSCIDVIVPSATSIHSVFTSSLVRSAMSSTTMRATASPDALQESFWNSLWPKTPTIFQASASLALLLAFILLGESFTMVLASTFLTNTTNLHWSHYHLPFI